MKILWVCNIIMPIIAKDQGQASPVTGGWMTGMLDSINEEADIEMVICFPAKSAKKIVGNVDGIKYYSFSQLNILKYNHTTEMEIEEILKKEKPDIVHIFGTEYPHALAAVNACENHGIIEKAVVSIQGLVSVHNKHYFAGLPHNVTKKYTIRDFIKRDNIFYQQKKMSIRGEFEVNALKKVKHVIGRTDWDKACTEQINKSVQYHYCNETLRSSFYQKNWDVEKCEKHSIFISQSGYPIKAFHMMLEAMVIILRDYPNAHLYTTGGDIMSGSWLSQQRHEYYYRYLNKIMKNNGLEKKISFLGSLSEEKVRERMLQANVFISTSAIENSPNSLGEAMLLGVPCVSSDVGGVRNMIKHGEEGYVYPFDEPYMAAYYVTQIFEDADLACFLSNNARAHASNTHSKSKNKQTMLNIYKAISDERDGAN